jgi:hypothetical protein
MHLHPKITAHSLTRCNCRAHRQITSKCQENAVDDTLNALFVDLDELANATYLAVCARTRLQFVAINAKHAILILLNIEA